MNSSEPTQDSDPILELIRQFKNAEAALHAALGDQTDAVLDPASMTPIVLQDAQIVLRASEARYRRLLSRMAAIVFELNPDGTTLFVNDAVFEVLGYTLTELQGRNWWDILLPNEQHRQVEELYRRFQSGDVTKYEIILTSKTGSRRIIELNSANRINTEGKLERIVGLGIDITERRETERLVAQQTSELSAANKKLEQLADERHRLLLSEQAARLEAEQAVKDREEFLAIAAHELKTPITSISGFADLLLHRINKQGTVDAASLELALKAIVQRSARLTTLITHLLDVSRLQAGRLSLEKHMVDMVVLINELVAQMQQKTSQHEISVHTPLALLAMVDPVRLEQVLINLLDNAIKYSPQGGIITVELLRPDTQTMWLTVTDQGLGIPPERREHIFERFYQAHTQGYLGGLGLGLYISKEIVELHDGHIEVQFPNEGGTRFIVKLPLNIS